MELVSDCYNLSQRVDRQVRQRPPARFDGRDQCIYREGHFEWGHNVIFVRCAIIESKLAMSRSSPDQYDLSRPIVSLRPSTRYWHIDYMRPHCTRAPHTTTPTIAYFERRAQYLVVGTGRMFDDYPEGVHPTGVTLDANHEWKAVWCAGTPLAPIPPFLAEEARLGFTKKMTIIDSSD